MKQPDTSALRERLAGYTSEQDIQELDGLTEKISGQINGLHNLLDEIKDLREEMHGIQPQTHPPKGTDGFQRLDCGQRQCGKHRGWHQ